MIFYLLLLLFTKFAKTKQNKTKKQEKGKEKSKETQKMSNGKEMYYTLLHQSRVRIRGVPFRVGYCIEVADKDM